MKIFLLALSLALSSCIPIFAQLPTTVQRPGLPTGKTLWVDGTNGNNTSAIRGRADKPYLTIQAALNAGVANDTVQVRSGTYAEYLTLKTGVNLAFDPGASLTYTGGSGTAIGDGGTNVTCRVTGLSVNAAAGSSDTVGIYLTGPSTSVILDAIDLTTTTDDSIAVRVNGASLRMTYRRITCAGAGTGILCESGTLVSQGLSPSAGIPINVSGGTATIQFLDATATANNQIIKLTGGTSIVRFDKLVDTGLSAKEAVLVSSGTHSIYGGSIARTTTGDGVKVTGGTLNLFSADITGSWAGSDKALNQTGGTLNVFPGARYDGTETSGTITKMPFFGTTPNAAGIAALGTRLSTTTTWDPASLNASTSEVKSAITLTGAAVGDPVIAALSSITTAGWEIQANVTATDTVAVYIKNNTGGTVDLASGTLTVIRP